MSYLSNISYTEWQKYLSEGRKKYWRPLYSAQGWEIQYTDKWNKNGDIQITPRWLSGHPFILIHPDNTKTISAPQNMRTNWGGTWSPLRSYNIRYNLWKYTGVEVIQRNFLFRIIERDAGTTPVKIQGCRSCSQTGKIDSWCSPTLCWDLDPITKTCETHPNMDLSDTLQARFNRHLLLCPHGQDNGHTVKRGQDCYRCNGTRKAAYGGKRISLPWDGSPLRIKDGNIVKKPLTELERILTTHVQQSSV